LVQFPVSEMVKAPLVIVPFDPISTSPDTVRPLLTVSVETFAAFPIVIDLAVDVLEMVGWNKPVKFASPIITSFVELGTPFVQLPEVPHAVLVVPFQLVD
jgi:hypothetical protein